MNTEPHILIAEDDAEDRFMMREAFKEINAHHHVVFCEDGYKLLEQLEHTATVKTGLIVLDLNMPRLNGTETLRILNSQPKWQHIPVIIFSADN